LRWNYQAPWWLPGGNAQTIYAAKWAKSTGQHQTAWLRERWKTPDADFVDVDWINKEQPQTDTNAPQLVLFHGLEGSSDSHYAQAFASQAIRQGWRMALPHFRGCSGDINLAPRAYHSGDMDEIDWLLDEFRRQHRGPLFAVGISLGGNALMRWAGEKGQAANQRIQGIAAISAPLDLTASGHAIDKGLNRHVYTRMFLKTMKPRALEKLAQYPGLFDGQALMAAHSLYAFDNVFTAPVHGFKNTDDYWMRASAKPGLCDICVPALILNARNDPFVPAWSLPQAHEVSQWVTLCQPATGGHVGFPDGAFPAHVNAMPMAVMDWLQTHLH
jgi:predicted alpha/beta-fold hydrolase